MKLRRTVNSAATKVEINGLLGQHPRIKERTLTLQLDEFLERLHGYNTRHVPAFEEYRRLRREIAGRERKSLRLDELKPQPLSTFVRNRLINEVYMEFIGANFAKQMGAAGDNKRTDLMGMLLLISPPGYGKTTLMEYLAQRLGLVFVKVNCPTLGHHVTSVDPSEAPNATARQELEKLNLALEMGNNVMLYLDDIQHSNPEFLQKFISMADAQRKIEGVWRGQPQTYDLRGKRFCLVMAGNPYTESGEMFKIPDMLANRADIYNLGDMLSGKEDVFALSYLENSLTSNPVLAPLATRDMQDVYRFIRLAQGQEVNSSEFTHQYSATGTQEIVAVLKKMRRVQEVLLKINRQYIESAAQQDAYRTEPPFKLQGSYRNMNKLAEKVVAVMNAQELENLIDDHYAGEAQTLTSGAEENLLKLAEMRGTQTPAQKKRWQEIKKTYARLQSTGSEEDDPATRVVNQISSLGTELGNISTTLAKAAHHQSSNLAEQVKQLNAYLAALPRLLKVIQQNTANLSGQAPQQVQETVRQPAEEFGKYLESLNKILRKISTTKPQVNIHTEVPDTLEPVVKQLVEMIDSTLMPLVQRFDRRVRLDFTLWNRLKEVSETLKEMDTAAFNRAREKRKQWEKLPE